MAPLTACVTNPWMMPRCIDEEAGAFNRRLRRRARNRRSSSASRGRCLTVVLRAASPHGARHAQSGLPEQSRIGPRLRQISGFLKMAMHNGRSSRIPAWSASAPTVARPRASRLFRASRDGTHGTVGLTPMQVITDATRNAPNSCGQRSWHPRSAARATT